MGLFDAYFEAAKKQKTSEKWHQFTKKHPMPISKWEKGLSADVDETNDSFKEKNSS